MVSVLNFFFWTVWSSDSAGRRSVREHAEPLGVRHRVARAFRRLRSLPQANGSKKMKEGGASVRRSVSRPRRAWAWRGMVRCRNRPEAKRRVRLPRRLDAGPGGVRRLWGRLGSPRGGAPWHRLTAGCPTRVFPVRRAFCCFLAGFVVCRRSGRQTCRVGLVMVRGQFRFGHRSPWMAAATMAARLHSSSIASARIAASMARSSPIHHSM